MKNDDITEGWLPEGGDDFSPKKVGLLGELNVQHELLTQGFNIYSPLCDDDQVDLVVETDYGFKKVQTKTITKMPRGTSIEIRLQKYINTGRVDVVAVHFLPRKITAFYPYNNERDIILALHSSKNGQEKDRNWFYRYERFPIIKTKDHNG